MSLRLKRRLSGLQQRGGGAVLAGARRGLEKESLRITPEGLVAQTPHPAALGSALTNAYITTDYSEALLEFVTPPEDSVWAAMQFMCDLHQFAFETIGDELLWPFSMPCRLRSEQDIPLATFGTSNIGRMKNIYRHGLGLRYGRYMQVISGIHFNYSVPDSFWRALSDMEGGERPLSELKSDMYMGLVRNVRRLDWLLLYLFGASPAICNSFVKGQDADLENMGNGSSYGRYATSLRMSDLGYQNTNQASLHVSANSLDEYIRDLTAAIYTPDPAYRELGVKDGDKYLQLNANKLQIENEYYSTIRPKRVARSGERPTMALSRGGIEYIELRALDISPFDPAGIGQMQQKFLEAFLLFGVLLESPPISTAEDRDLRHNHALIARRGREPGLTLARNGEAVTMRDWALEICEQLEPVCELLDQASDEGGYAESLEAQVIALRDPERTPSARLLAAIDESGLSYADYGLQVARGYRDYFKGLAPELNRHRSDFVREAADSLSKQADIEAADTLTLDEYLERYFAQT